MAINITDKEQYLKDTKTKLKDAINEKGGNITDQTPFREYADEIQEKLRKHVEYVEKQTDVKTVTTTNVSNAKVAFSCCALTKSSGVAFFDKTAYLYTIDDDGSISISSSTATISGNTYSCVMARYDDTHAIIARHTNAGTYNVGVLTVNPADSTISYTADTQAYRESTSYSPYMDRQACDVFCTPEGRIVIACMRGSSGGTAGGVVLCDYENGSLVVKYAKELPSLYNGRLAYLGDNKFVVLCNYASYTYADIGEISGDELTISSTAGTAAYAIDNRGFSKQYYPAAVVALDTRHFFAIFEYSDDSSVGDVIRHVVGLVCIVEDDGSVTPGELVSLGGGYNAGGALAVFKLQNNRLCVLLSDSYPYPLSSSNASVQSVSRRASKIISWSEKDYSLTVSGGPLAFPGVDVANASINRVYSFVANANEATAAVVFLTNRLDSASTGYYIPQLVAITDLNVEKEE